MENVLFFVFPIPHQKPQTDSRGNPAAVTPVIDHRHKKAEDKKNNNPDADLLVDRSPIHASAALAVVKQGAGQAAYRRGSANGPWNRSEIRNQKTDDTAQAIDNEHSINTIFPGNQQTQLSKSRHKMNYPAAELRGIIAMRSLQIISAVRGISVYRFFLGL